MTNILETNPANCLPPLVCSEFFSYLDPKDLGSCALVCRKWQRLVGRDEVWVKVAIRISGQAFVFQGGEVIRGILSSHSSMTNIQVPIKAIVRKAVQSDDILLKRLQIFLNKVHLGKNGIFTCLFPEGYRCQRLVVEFKGKGTIFDREPFDAMHSLVPDIKDDYYGMQEIGNSPLETIDDLQYINPYLVYNYVQDLKGQSAIVFPSHTAFDGAIIRFYHTLPMDAPHYSEMATRIQEIVQRRIWHIYDDEEKEGWKFTFKWTLYLTPLMLTCLYLFMSQNRKS